MAGFAVHLFKIYLILLSDQSGPLGHGEAFKPFEGVVIIEWATFFLEKEPLRVDIVTVIGVATVRPNEGTIFCTQEDFRVELLDHHRERVHVDGELRRLSYDGADQLGDLKLEVVQIFQALGLEFQAPTFLLDKT